MKKPKTRANKLVIFQSKKIRRIWYEEDWYYSVVDIIAALTESPTPRQYWEKIKQREFIKLQLSPIWGQLKLESVPYTSVIWQSTKLMLKCFYLPKKEYEATYSHLFLNSNENEKVSKRFEKQ